MSSPSISLDDLVARIAASIEGTSLDERLSEIVERAPREHGANLKNLRRFLCGSLPTQLRKLSPWDRRHWRRLHRASYSDVASRVQWIDYFFEEVFTAQCNHLTDAESKVLMDAVRNVFADQNDLNRLRKRVTREVNGLGSDQRDEYLDQMGWFSIGVSGHGRVLVWLSARDLLFRSRAGYSRSKGGRRRGGSGRRILIDSASERMMRFLTAAGDPTPNRIRVPINTAAKVTEDVLGWAIGDQPRSSESIAKWWIYLLKNPAQAPIQL